MALPNNPRLSQSTDAPRLTGWFNLLGQVAVTTGISFGLAGLIATAAKVKNPDFEGSAPQTIGIYAAVLVSHVRTSLRGDPISPGRSTEKTSIRSSGRGSLTQSRA